MVFEGGIGKEWMQEELSRKWILVWRLGAEMWKRIEVKGQSKIVCEREREKHRYRQKFFLERSRFCAKQFAQAILEWIMVAVFKGRLYKHNF